jgi:signal transduction histidine kinase
MGQESGYVFIDIGNIYFQLKLDNMARTFYRKAEMLFEERNDLIGRSIALGNYGSLHSRSKPGGDSSFFYFSKSLALQEQANDPFYMAHSLRALALYYSHNGNSAKAHQTISRAIRLIRNTKIKEHPRYKWDVQFIPQQVYLTASDIYRNENAHLDSAEYYLKKSIQMTKVHGVDAHRTRYITFLATFYLEQKQFDKAHAAIQQALSLADSVGYVWGKVGALQALRNYYHQTKDTAREAQAAYDYLFYKDKMFNERNNDELIVMSNLILQYENELQIERQQSLIKEKERINEYQKRQNYLLWIVVAVLFFGLTLIAILYRSLRTKKRLVDQYSREVEASNETMRTMLSVISHDVRSPFTSLLGLSQITLLENDLSSEDYRSRVSMMHETSSKGLILLDNLLQWVALQRDKTLIKKEPVEVHKLISETLSELNAVALTQNVTFIQEVEENVLHTDRNAAKTIIRNLLTNAIKYSAGKQVMLAAKKSGASLLIRVTDQGPGIPDELLQTLFQPGDMKKVAAKGSGLGMQIVRQLVEELSGKIKAKNLPDGGAQFEVELPLS